MWRAVVCSALLGACNQVYGLEGTDLSDVPDFDQDEVPDTADNCVEVANKGQHDIDNDGVGDVCDNCPLASNFDQNDYGDGDEVGDACDPHPINKGDCLAYLDSMTDYMTFDTRWEVLRDSNDTTSTYLPRAGSVQLSAPPDHSLVIASREPTLAGVSLSLQLVGQGRVADLFDFIAVVAQLNDTNSGFWCGLTSFGGPLATLRSYPDGNTAQVYVGQEPIGSDFLLRLNIVEAAANELLCRVVHGYTDTTVQYGMFPPLPAGRPGAAVHGVDVEISGFAAYTFTPGSPCATAFY